MNTMAPLIIKAQKSKIKLYFPRCRSKSTVVGLIIFLLITCSTTSTVLASVSTSPILSQNQRKRWTQNNGQTSSSSSSSSIPDDANTCNGRTIADDANTCNGRKRRNFPNILPINHDIKNRVQEISRRGQITLTRSIPTLRDTTTKRIDSVSSINGGKQPALLRNNDTLVDPVSMKIKSKEIMRNILDFQKSGFYYGIDLDTMMSKKTDSNIAKQRPPKLKDTMNEALIELRLLRQEMERMRIEMQQLKRKMVGEDDDENIDEYSSEEAKAKRMTIRRKKKKEAEKLAGEIEIWANAILQEGEEDGWKRLECNKMFRASVNGMERTSAYMKWLPDSRGEKADKEDHSKHPCIKCFSTIDAPLEEVCTYLSQPDKSVEYNDVVEHHKDIETISPSAKICWSQSPQILFVKPRDFVTFCHHRWKSDGTEVIVNQACEHPKFPIEKMEKEGKSCRGYALRGINSK